MFVRIRAGSEFSEVRVRQAVVRGTPMSEVEHRPTPWKPGQGTKIPGSSRLRPGGMETAWWARLERAWWPALIGTMVVFSIFPLANMLLGLSTKDYGLWYQV